MVKMVLDPVFQEKFHEVIDCRTGDRKLLEVNSNKLKYWLSGTAEYMIIKHKKKLKDGIANQILQKQSLNHEDLYMVTGNDLENL